MLHSRRARARAFTLVELLVVIGIIALLISILLPVMGRVRSQGRTVSCQANLRSILQTLLIYAADNKGSLPYSFVWNQMVLAPGAGRTGQSSGTPAYSFNWASMCSKIMKPTANSAGMLSFAGFAPVFRCPEGVTRPEFIQAVHYSVQSVAMPTLRYELGGYPFSGDKELANRWPIKPARVGRDLYNENALIWDSPLNITFLNWEPDADKQLGPEWSEIDGGQLTYPSAPSLRYRDTTDWYAGLPDLSWGFPIFYPSPVTAPQLEPNTDLTTNAFPPNLTISNVHTGTPRWRHNQNQMCNVGFADGSVKPIQWYPKRYVKGTSPAQGYAANDFLRRYIMIKWPTDRVPEF